ncbi:MAG: hypothetical protein GY761_10300 [Hyphomicrobiales bacterium]|nr:hypothetical protein [Hyphomicrobiales bacterium]
MLGTDFGGPGSLTPLDNDIKTLVEKMAAGGWAGLDQLEKNQANNGGASSQFTDEDHTAENFYTCFSTAAGQKVLEYLVECVILMPSAGLTPGQSIEQHAAMAIASDAQKMLVWHMLAKMRQAMDKRNQTTTGGKNADIS